MFHVRDMTPTCPDAFLHTLLTYPIKDNLSSIITSSSFILECCSVVESILMFSCLYLFFRAETYHLVLKEVPSEEIAIIAFWDHLSLVLIMFSTSLAVLPTQWSWWCFPSTLRMKCFQSTLHMGYWPSVRSRWLDIGQVLFMRVYGPRRSRGP